MGETGDYLKCDVCGKRFPLKKLNVIQVWLTLTRAKKCMVQYYDGSTREQSFNVDDCEKQIIACRDCTLNLNFREAKPCKH